MNKKKNVNKKEEKNTRKRKIEKELKLFLITKNGCKPVQLLVKESKRKHQKTKKLKIILKIIKIKSLIYATGGEYKFRQTGYRKHLSISLSWEWLAKRG